MEAMRHMAPICATVSRRTGEIRIDWTDDADVQLRFGRVMNAMGRIVDAWEDARAREDAFRSAAVKAEMKGCESLPTG